MKSIMQKEKKCYLCGAKEGLEKIHIFDGDLDRKISEREGFWVWVAKSFRFKADLGMKQLCQLRYQKTHSWKEFLALTGGKTWV